VAAAYAERAAGAARQANRIKQVEQDAFHRIDRERDAWVVVTLLPDVPGDLPITAASSNEFQEATIGTEPAIVPLGINLHRARVGRRRFLADGTSGNSPLAQYASLELHADGAGASGLVLPDFQAMRMFGQDPPQPMNQVVNDEWIVVAVLSGLARLAQHARDLTAASGNAVVRATLLPATSAESPHQYGGVILPMTVLRRLDCVLEPSRDLVREIATAEVREELRDVKIKRATGLSFYNTSPWDFARLVADPDGLQANLIDYIGGFSKNIDVFERFRFENEIAAMAEKNWVRPTLVLTELGSLSVK
jgi:hypothetical protein